MNFKPTEKQKKNVTKFITKWRDILFLQEWDFKTSYHAQEDERGASASTRGKWIYRDGAIDIYPRFFEATLEEQSLVILHELCHFLTNPLDELALQASSGVVVTSEHREDIREMVTTQIANAIFYKK